MGGSQPWNIGGAVSKYRMVALYCMNFQILVWQQPYRQLNVTINMQRYWYCLPFDQKLSGKAKIFMSSCATISRLWIYIFWKIPSILPGKTQAFIIFVKNLPFPAKCVWFAPQLNCFTETRDKVWIKWCFWHKICKENLVKVVHFDIKSCNFVHGRWAAFSPSRKKREEVFSVIWNISVLFPTGLFDGRLSGGSPL